MGSISVLAREGNLAMEKSLLTILNGRSSDDKMGLVYGEKKQADG